MKNILWFKEVNKSDIASVGGKGASLGEMYNIGLPIPPGFCVSAQAYQKFLEDSGLDKKIYPILEGLNVEDTDALHDAAEKVQEMIIDSEVPPDLKVEIKENYFNMSVDIDIIKTASRETVGMIKAGRDIAYVAVRSSATAEDLPTASFAGQQATYLNIRGGEELVKAVKKCWASLFTARAIYYRVKNKFDHSKVFISVIVQKMVDSVSAGVMFTVNPSTNNDKEIVIEAAFGLGETVVGGSITPDRYLVDKSTLAIKNKEINEQPWGIVRDYNLKRSVKKNLSAEEGGKQKVSDNNIKLLGELGMKIEEHYKVPQDIEFAIEGNKVYIVQSRPVTTFETTKEALGKQETLKDKEVILKGLNAGPGIGSGKVVLVHGVDDLSKVGEGDVLVARMTNPDMVPAMKRASAIITDAGGTTCMGGDTKVLTNKGFMSIESAYDLVKDEDLMILSYDYKNKKPTWKSVINSFKRKSKAIKISTSQTGRVSHNTLDITPNHKIYTYKNRNLIKKEINNVLEDEEHLCLIDSLPKTGSEKDIRKLAYLMGAIITDGHIRIDYNKTGNPRRGSITLTQKEVEEKVDFIQEVNNCLVEVFDKGFTNSTFKETQGCIRGGLIQGTATDFVSHNLQAATQLNKIYQNLDLWTLSLNEESSLAFLAGLIDGDGCFYENRLHIYNNDEKTLQGIILSCLKLNIFPQISKNRDSYHIQIVERMGDILRFTKRVKGVVSSKVLGTKLLSAKQILSDVVDEVNLKGKIKPYVEKNLLIDSRKIFERVLPVANEKLKNELIEVLNSNLRMHRISKVCDMSEIDVFNLEVEANEEMERNYIVFTKNYTPLLVSNCHAAIVGREMGLPVVVGAMKATQVLKDGDEVTVDGYTGNIYRGIVEVDHKGVEEVVEGPVEKIETVTEIKTIMDLPDYAEKAAKKEPDGVGLLRAEFMILGRKLHPGYLIAQGRKEEFVNNLAEDIKKIAKAFNGKSIWYRTLDAPTDEFRHLEGGENEPEEDNPMMGWRSIRRDLDQPELLKAQFEAIKKIHDEGFTNVGVMIPLVTSVEQISKAKQYLKEVGLEPLEEIEFGVMVETPAAVEIISDICAEGVDFISFGTNDLTQFTLAVDRNNAKIQGLYNEMHPAVLSQIKRVIRVCQKNNVETSICGQAGSNPDMIEWLVKQGIDSISVNPDMITQARKLVYKTERRMLLKAARKED